MASLFGPSAIAVDPKKTFVDKLKETNYGVVIEETLEYDVFVHRSTFADNFHHKIVLKANQYKLGYVTVELGKNDNYSQILAQSLVYQGDVSELEFKGTVTATLRQLADIAMEILVEMGDYRLAGNNCQNFCNKFLERVGLVDGKYMTTAKKGAIGTAVIGGIAVAGLIAAAVFGVYQQSSHSSQSKKKRTNHS